MPAVLGRVLGVASGCVLALAAACGSSNPDVSPMQMSSGGSDAMSGGSDAGGAVGSGGTPTDTGSGGGLVMIGQSGAADGGDLGVGEECARATTKAEPVPSNLLFVIDTSGSMNCNPPDGDADLGARCARFPIQEDLTRPSKWEVVKGALSSALSALADHPRLSAGLTLFPKETACGVAETPDVPIAALDSDQVDAISAALDDVEPQGDTPLAGATILSFAHLADELRAGRLSGNSFVILLTDGAETCAPSVLDELVDTDVPNARLFDIRTFVIGAPGSEAARSLLSRVAFEGGTPSTPDCDHSGSDAETGDCHFDMTTTTDFESELARTLDAISQTQAISCTLDVPNNPDGGRVDLDRVNVTFLPAEGEDERILQDAMAACDDGADGWQYNDDRTQILLCGSACDRVRTTPGEVRIVLGCPTVTVR